MRKTSLFTAGVFGLLLIASTALAAAPDGSAGPWADTVEDTNQALRKNGTAVLVDRSDPTQALGPAESTGTPFDSPVVAGSFYSLGFGGDITLGFDNAVFDGVGDDLQIYEITGGTSYPIEKVDVEVSVDGVNWELAADDLERDGGVDLANTNLSCIHYVRITDDSNVEPFEQTADAYDLDAVEALNWAEGACPSIHGFKWHDENLDGDPLDEELLQGWTIQLLQDDQVIAETVTMEDGWYWFVGLLPGDYEVREVLQDGWFQTFPGDVDNPQGHLVLGLDFGDTVEDAHFGNHPLEWCSPGYWRQEHHLDSWEATGIEPNELYSDYFPPVVLKKKAIKDGANPNPTLLQVLQSPQWYGEGAFNNVGDLLSGAHPDVEFHGERVDNCPLN